MFSLSSKSLFATPRPPASATTTRRRAAKGKKKSEERKAANNNNNHNRTAREITFVMKYTYVYKIEFTWGNGIKMKRKRKSAEQKTTTKKLHNRIQHSQGRMKSTKDFFHIHTRSKTVWSLRVCFADCQFE